MNTITRYALLDQNNLVINPDYKGINAGIGSTFVGIGSTFVGIGSTFVGIGSTFVGIGSTFVGIGITQITHIIEYGDTNSLIVNDPDTGYTLDTTLNAFIPPKPDPTYLLDETNFTWNPDPSLTYDLHNDGKLYRYDLQLSGWIPTWEDDSMGVGTT